MSDKDLALINLAVSFFQPFSFITLPMCLLRRGIRMGNELILNCIGWIYRDYDLFNVFLYLENNVNEKLMYWNIATMNLHIGLRWLSDIPMFPSIKSGIDTSLNYPPPLVFSLFITLPDAHFSLIFIAKGFFFFSKWCFILHNGHVNSMFWRSFRKWLFTCILTCY